jgi:DNA-binding SARP family transcriptional activator
MAYVSAQLAAGWVALARNDRERAAVEGEAAARAARLRRDRAGLAEALELRGLATNDRRRQAVWLEEAVSIWRAIRDPLGEAHAELILGLSTREEAGAARAEEAERRLRAAGAHGYRILPASGLPSAPQAPLAPIKVSTLGRFGVVRDGRPLGRDEWKSKKARDLLKLLVARRGRPTPRDVLMEALWPQHDPKRLANRLSVALSTLRSVLDPDRRHPSDHFLVSSAGAIGLRSANVEVDVETFIERSEQALDSYRNRPDESLPLLEAAEAAYVGDFLEEDLYEDWATPLREEARAQYLAVVVALAETAEAAGQADATIRYRLRALERDSYDEGAHLGLVAAFLAAGRHGEARRAYREYTARMEEIGVEPEPFSQGERWAAHTPAS